MVIDAHQHFWVYDGERDAWITEEMSVIRRNFFPENLIPLLAENNIDGCVAVQAAQSESETEFLLQLAEANDFIKGVVGWTDLRSPDLYDRLDFYAQYEKLSGFRHIVQAESDDFLTRPDFINGVKALHAFDFTYDILIYPTQLEAALYFVRQMPEMKLVIDHLAKPYIKSGEIEAWARSMKALAAFPNVFCKVSGMVTEADWKNWKKEDFAPYLDVVFEEFGCERLMYGSDWPVCLVAGEYKDQKSILDNYLFSYTEEQKAMVMGGNAIRFYNLS
jgi:L-fuconolactonase